MNENFDEKKHNVKIITLDKEKLRFRGDPEKFQKILQSLSDQVKTAVQYIDQQEKSNDIDPNRNKTKIFIAGYEFLFGQEPFLTPTDEVYNSIDKSNYLSKDEKKVLKDSMIQLSEFLKESYPQLDVVLSPGTVFWDKGLPEGGLKSKKNTAYFFFSGQNIGKHHKNSFSRDLIGIEGLKITTEICFEHGRRVGNGGYFDFPTKENSPDIQYIPSAGLLGDGYVLNLPGLIYVQHDKGWSDPMIFRVPSDFRHHRFENWTGPRLRKCEKFLEMPEVTVINDGLKLYEFRNDPLLNLITKTRREGGDWESLLPEKDEKFDKSITINM